MSEFHLKFIENSYQNGKNSHINDGPIKRNSTVLKPFSPVPTNTITKPRATVPKPTYKKAFANELGPLIALKKSSSEEPIDESCI